MIERPLLTADELKSLPKGHFIIMKTGAHPMQTVLRLFLDWGITFGEPYITEERFHRKVAYADKALNNDTYSPVLVYKIFDISVLYMIC